MMSRVIKFIREHMVVLGAVFISSAVVLFGLGLQACFTWENPTLSMVLYVLSGLFFVFGLSLAIIGIIRQRGDINPFQRERDKRLKSHFENMWRENSSIIPTLNIKF